MATSSVVLDTTQYVRVNVGYTSMILQAHRDSVRIAVSDNKPSYNNIAFHLLGGSDAPLPIDPVDTNVWALAVSDRSSLIVTESSVLTPRTVSDPNATVMELDPLVNSIPTTSTFHHLGHEGKVFAHSDRHPGISNGTTVNYQLRIPAGEPARQVHMRFGFIAKAITGTLDVDVEFWKGSTVSVLGSSESFSSTNDAIVRTTGVLLYYNSTVTDYGTFKTATAMVGEKKSANNLDQAVPEWILTPNGSSARDYVFKITNNSGGDIDLIAGIFFYDTHAVLI